MKKKILYIFLILSLMMIPTTIFATVSKYDYATDDITYYSSASEAIDDTITIEIAIAMEAFVSIHMSLFVFFPISCMISKNNKIRTFIILFSIRIIILLYFDYFVSTIIAIVDFLAVFFGAFIVVPILAIITVRKNKNSQKSNPDISISNLSKTSSQSKILSLNSNKTVECKTCGTTYKIKKIKNNNPIKKDLNIGEINKNEPIKNENSNNGPIKYN